MAHTFTHLLTHIVFSTKERQPWLVPELKPRLFAYMGGIIRELDGHGMLINGPADHVHILTTFPARVALSDFMRDLKANSSGWVHDQFPEQPTFSWQTGYGAFAVSQSNLEQVKQYIQNQEAHHRKRSFKEEFVEFLKRHHLQYDERFLWE
jgi:putative transposase